MKKTFYLLLHLISQGWTVFGKAIVFIILIESVLYIFFLLEENTEPLSLLDKNAPIPESYTHTHWYKDYVIEFSKMSLDSAWKPYVYWKTKPFSGKYINIDSDSNRKTWTPPHKKHPIKIFMLGGSTLWGWGARDDFTIPSLVSKILYEKYKIDAEVINLSEIGYVSTQEVIRLITELQQQNFPQFVVCYDGLNDMCSTLRAGQTDKVGVPWDEIEREKSFENEKSNIANKAIHAYANDSSLYHFISKIFHKSSETLPPSQIDQLASAILKMYQVNINVVKSLSKTYQFNTLFYWQPTILSKNDPTDGEKHIIAEGEKYLHCHRLHTLINKNLTHITEETFHNISDILSDHGHPFYIDYFHIDETGNAIIAKKMAKDIFSQYPKELGKNNFYISGNTASSSAALQILEN